MVWLQSTQQEIKHINIKKYLICKLVKNSEQNKQKQDY